MTFSLPVGHNCKHLKSTSVRHLIALFEITTRSRHWATAQTREWGSCSNMASDSVRSGPTNYEDSTPEWASDTFAYRSPHKNPFLRFAYPRVKKPTSCQLRYCSCCIKFHVWCLFRQLTYFCSLQAAMLLSTEFICLRVAYRKAFWEELSRLIGSSIRPAIAV